MKNICILFRNKQPCFVDSNSSGKIKNIKIIDNKFLIYDWISTGGSIRKVYDINLEKNIGKVVNGKTYYNKYVIGCGDLGASGGVSGIAQIFNLNTKINKDFGKGGLIINTCSYGKGDILYFTLQDYRGNKEKYKYEINKDLLYVDANRFYDTGWESVQDVFLYIYVNESKKGEFIKYIGANVEGRQDSMYTYFYFDDKLINTVKNKIKNDYELILGNSMEFVDTEDYLSSYYAKKKLDLYSATLENNNRIFFVKKTDEGQTNFAYDLEAEKLESWSFDYYGN